MTSNDALGNHLKKENTALDDPTATATTDVDVIDAGKGKGGALHRLELGGREGRRPFLAARTTADRRFSTFLRQILVESELSEVPSSDLYFPGDREANRQLHDWSTTTL